MTQEHRPHDDLGGAGHQEDTRHEREVIGGDNPDVDDARPGVDDHDISDTDPDADPEMLNPRDLR